MAYIVSLHALLVPPYWSMFLWIHFSHFTSLLGMACFVSLHASLVHHHFAWFVLLDYALHWFFITGHGLYCFTSCLID
jgi:hypothetical protein